MAVLRRITFFHFLVFSGSCVHTTRSSWTAKDLVVSENPRITPPADLTNAEVEVDKSYLKYALLNGYGGRRFLPGKRFEIAMTAIDNISGSLLNGGPIRDPVKRQFISQTPETLE